MSKLKFGFRSKFELPSRDLLRWFPGHMGKGFRVMQQKLSEIDCLIEVHDARIPFTGRNPDFTSRLCGIKPHILILNKSDTISKFGREKILDSIDFPAQNIIFTNCKDQKCDGVRNLVPLVAKLISQSNRFNRLNSHDFCCMIIGVPNVGKSSLINMLRHKNMSRGGATQVGARPGITRSVLSRIKISENPLLYLIDTPGVLTPNVADIETGMRLALCECLQDHLVGEDFIADYLLYWLNRHERFDYVPLCGLHEPTDSILRVLSTLAIRERMTITKRDLSGSLTQSYRTLPDLISAARLFLSFFRDGRLGKIILDQAYFCVKPTRYCHGGLERTR